MHALIIGLLLLAGAPASMAQQSHAPHEHGAAELRVSIQDRTVRIELSTPLDNLVGFEHAPRTDQQRLALTDAEETLRNIEGLFQFAPEAACTLTALDLHSPWPLGRDDHDHDRATERRQHHAEMEVTYDLECVRPQALTELQVLLIDRFPRMHRIRTETATPRGQNAVTLDKSKRSLPL